MDSCVWGGARADLEAAGHDVEWTGDWERDPGDEAILAYAVQEQRVLVTIDKDFGDLTVVRGQSHCGIVRLAGFAAREVGSTCRHVLAAYEPDLIAGALITASPGRVRVRPPEPHA